MASGFDETYERFLADQRREAAGMRKEMLERDLTGTRKLLEVLLPVFGTLEDMVLEYEVVSTTGTRIYVDVFHRILRIAFHAHGYVVHAERITRDKFSFEQMRVRTFTMYGYKHVPFSWDELDKKPDMCRRAVFELLGRFGKSSGGEWMKLPVYEREVIRCAAIHPGAFGVREVQRWLQLGPEASRLVIRSMVEKHLLELAGGSVIRFHELRLAEAAGALIP